MSNKNWVKNYIGKKKVNKEKEEVANNWQEVIDKLLKEAEQQRQVAALQASIAPSSWFNGVNQQPYNINYTNQPDYNYVIPSINYQIKQQSSTGFNMFADISLIRKFYPSGNGVFFPCE